MAGVTAGTNVTVGGDVFEAVAGTASSTQFDVSGTDAQAAMSLANSVNQTTESRSTSASAVNGNTITFSMAATDMVATDLDYATADSSKFVKTSVAASSSRAASLNQYNAILAQLYSVAGDSGYKGINLLGSSNNSIDVKFEGTNKLTVTGFNGNSTGLGINTTTANWATQANVDTDIAKLDTALSTLRTNSQNLASNLSIVTARQDWTSDMVNVLQTGADNLTLADTNEEGANMLMLQTRQTLGTTALSLSAQSAQSVLRLF
jgi:flagellin-like hook-associated protein FlgL